jgi:hypothetical protein
MFLPGTLRTLFIGILLAVPALSAALAPGGGPDSIAARDSVAGVQDETVAGTPNAASRWWTRVYAAGFYDTRWNGWFLQAYGQHAYDLSEDRRVSLYGIGWLTTDSRSTGAGTLPVIISDNVFILGAGLRFKPAPWVWFDVQEGVAVDLVERDGVDDVRHDFRLLATGGGGIYPDLRVHDDVQAPLTLMADAFGSAGFYSRYENSIAYLQGRLGARALEYSRMFVDVYLRGDLAFDANGDYYNNIYEIGPGLRFTPDPDWGLFLMVEYRSGHYANFTEAMQLEREQFYPPTYDAWRFFLVFDRTF